MWGSHAADTAAAAEGQKEREEGQEEAAEDKGMNRANVHVLVPMSGGQEEQEHEGGRRYSRQQHEGQQQHEGGRRREGVPRTDKEEGEARSARLLPPVRGARRVQEQHQGEGVGGGVTRGGKARGRRVVR